MRRIDWQLVLLFLSAALVLAAGLGLREPSPPDEPRFAMAARDMVETGNWLIPHRGTEIYSEKPPMFMWMQASAYAALGNLRVAFLLPSLLAALLTLWLVHDLARRLWTREAGLAAATALAVCLQFGLQAKRAQIDMVLVAMMTFALWAMARHLLLGGAARWLWTGAFAAGLGTVTKGVGFLPLLIIPIVLIAQRVGAPSPPREFPVERGRWWLVLPAFVAGTAVWLAPLLIEVALRDDAEIRQYASELLFRQTGERYFNAWHHVQPAWYFLPVIVTMWLPGSLLLPWLLPAWWRRVREFDRAQIALLGWTLAVLLFFSASPGKREVYIFPMLPALCVAAAPLLAGIVERRAVRWLLLAYAALLSVGMLAFGIAELTGLRESAEAIARSRGMGSADLQRFLVALVVAGSIATGIVLLTRVRRAVLGVVLATAVLWITYGVGLLPALDASSSASAVMQRAARHLGPDAELGLVAWTEQMRLQADRPAADFGFKAPVETQWQRANAWAKASPSSRWLLVRRDVAEACIAPDHFVDLGVANRRHWVLLRGDAVETRCGR